MFHVYSHQIKLSKSSVERQTVLLSKSILGIEKIGSQDVDQCMYELIHVHILLVCMLCMYKGRDRD